MSFCYHDGCNTRAGFNFEGEKKPLYCSKHKKDGMINIISKRCKSDWCDTHANKKYDDYCLHCFVHLFPDRELSRNYKTKEKTVSDFITNEFPHFDWIVDKTIQGGCSRRRPDILLDLGCQILIIEIDEDQHTRYDCSCENKRIMQIYEDLNHRPIIFIRFNPDKYNNKGINIQSCWAKDKKGICKIKKTKTDEWNDRLTCLKEKINYWINEKNITDKAIETIELYYDID